VLPTLLMIFLALHVALFRRHGLTVRDPNRAPDTTFWPEQLLRDAIACFAVMVIVLVLVLRNYPTADPSIPLGGQMGAELGAPANPSESYAAARPELYFLFLFQLLKYLEAFPPIVGAVIVPGLVMLSLFLMPFIGKWELGHRFNVVWTFALLIGAGVLTALAWRADHNGSTPASQHYLHAVEDAESQAARVVVLANSPSGIPPEGALTLLRDDPKTQGPKLFRQHCAACHDHAPPAKSNADPSLVIVAEKSSAPNLWGIGSRDWVRGLLDPKQIASPHYFGNTAHKEGEMVTFVNDNIGTQLAELKDAELEALKKRIDDVTFTLANEAGMIREKAADIPARIEAGRAAILSGENGGFSCIDCHKFHEDGDLGLAPDLTGYASRDWLTAFISNPAHERFYPETNDRMPAFAANDENPTANRLSKSDLDILVSFLRGDWYEPPVGNPAASKP
jgi:ubiquinol-cytochrome c reductase cytochrome b subunit